MENDEKDFGGMSNKIDHAMDQLSDCETRLKTHLLTLQQQKQKQKQHREAQQIVDEIDENLLQIRDCIKRMRNFGNISSIVFDFDSGKELGVIYDPSRVTSFIRRQIDLLMLFNRTTNHCNKNNDNKGNNNKNNYKNSNKRRDRQNGRISTDIYNNYDYDEDDINTTIDQLGSDLAQLNINENINNGNLIDYDNDNKGDYQFPWIICCDPERMEYHRFVNNNTIECNYASKHSFDTCNCMFRSSNGMKPNSGVYRLKMLINKVNKGNELNMIGLTCNDSLKFSDYKKNKRRGWFDSEYYIGWSAFGAHYPRCLPNGLICGWDTYQDKSIFNGYEYNTRNNKHKAHLPGWTKDDIVIIKYDSNNRTLEFGKENDNNVDVIIKCLPKNKVFYWMVGHRRSQMSITIEHETNDDDSK